MNNLDNQLIAAFDYEIRNSIDLGLQICKTTPLSSPMITSMVMYEEELLNTVKEYMLKRINELKQKEKQWETKLIGNNG